MGRYIGQHQAPKPKAKVIIQAIERKTVLFLDDVHAVWALARFGREAPGGAAPVLGGECCLPKIADEKSGCREVNSTKPTGRIQLPTILMAGYYSETRRF